MTHILAIAWLTLTLLFIVGGFIYILVLIVRRDGWLIVGTIIGCLIFAALTIAAVSVLQ